jgi:uncharacterized membrane protein
VAAVALVAVARQDVGEDHMSKRSLQRRLGTIGLRKIDDAITAAEKTTSAEIAVFIREWSSYLSLFRIGDAHARVRNRAETLFVEHGLDRTAAHNGVMIYVSLGEHAAVVLGDTAINARVSPETWREIVDALVKAAKNGRLVDGICTAVGASAAVLTEHFPLQHDDKNEIRNQPNIGARAV